MQSHADVDPNAPPALKASPSVSGDDEGQLCFVLATPAEHYEHYRKMFVLLSSSSPDEGQLCCMEVMLADIGMELRRLL